MPIKEQDILDKRTLEKSQVKYKSIQELTRILIEKTSIKDVAELVVEKTIYQLGFTDCSFHLLRENQLELISFHTTLNEYEKAVKSSSKKNQIHNQILEVVKTESAIVSSKKENTSIKSQITVPLIYNKKVIGILDSCSSEENYFTEDHLETLETIASLTSVKIIQIKRNKELETYKAQLEDLVSKRTKDLENTLQELQLKNKEINRKNQSLNILLQEVHHRVANNLQIILSLIRIKYMASEENVNPNQFKDLENRILSMSLVHQNIMNKGYISREDFSSYISDLLRHIQLSNGFMKTIKLTKNIETFSIHPNIVFYLGLILTEIISNSIKHGFDSVENPEIIINIHKDQVQNILEIEDNGSGFKFEYWDQNKPASGFDVIKILTEQIEGEITCSSNGRTFYEIVIPIS